MASKKDKMKFYSLDKILSNQCTYNVVFGERSNGKTYACLERAIKRYATDKSQTAIIRRWQDDFKGKRGAVMFDNHVENGLIEKYTKGEWTGVYYYSGRWYFCKYDEDNKRINDDQPFCYAFALTSMEHDKSTAYPHVNTIIFDEFLTRSAYLPDEFVLFMNVISTIIRHRTGVEIFMLGNTVNKFCPYFKEMGLNKIDKMKPGTIDVYTYGTSELRVAVEYADMPAKKKASDYYFAFDNPKLHMITNGAWEIDIYPHCPMKYKPKDVIFVYFIKFEGAILQCEIISCDGCLFTYIHQKTTEIKFEDSDLIYSLEYDPRPNWHRLITKPARNIHKKVLWFFHANKVFYQDNEIGEIVRNYLVNCKNL